MVTTTPRQLGCPATTTTVKLLEQLDAAVATSTTNVTTTTTSPCIRDVCDAIIVHALRERDVESYPACTAESYPAGNETQPVGDIAEDRAEAELHLIGSTECKPPALHTDSNTQSGELFQRWFFETWQFLVILG